MDDNLPNQQGADDRKLQELENELQELEKRARGQLNQAGDSPTAAPQTQPHTQQVARQPQPQTPQAQTPEPPVPLSNVQPPKGVPNETQDSSGGGMRTVMWIALVIFLLALVGAGGYYLGMRGTSQSPTPTPVSQTPSPSPTVSPVSGWETLENETGWSIRYPEEVEVSENGATSFIQFGPTQEEGTEFYDGISVTIRTGALGGMTLGDFVDEQIIDIENDPISEVSNGPSEVVVAGLEGYRFTTTGLGTFEYYYLPMGETSYLEVIDATQDPTGQGFENTVQMMLDTIEIGISLGPSPSPSVSASPSVGI